MQKLCGSGGGLEEGDQERVGLLSGVGWGALGSWPHHSAILHQRTLKWRVRTNSSKKALKTRRQGPHRLSDCPE